MKVYGQQEPLDQVEQWECAANTPMGMPDDWCHLHEGHTGPHSWEPASSKQPMKVYIVLVEHDYEGWGLPTLVTTDREKAIQSIRDDKPPMPGEEYEVYEYELDKEDQGDCIATRWRHQPVWVKPEPTEAT